MANRYWVGGSGDWTIYGSSPHWSATSGGPGGESSPSQYDDVYFDANSGGGVCSIILTQVNCKNFNCTGTSISFIASNSSSFTNINAYGTLIDLGSASFDTNVSINNILYTAGNSTVNLREKIVGFTATGDPTGSNTGNYVTVSGASNAFTIAAQYLAGFTITDGNINLSRVPNGVRSFGCSNVASANIGTGSINCNYVYFINSSVSGSRSITLDPLPGQSATTNFHGTAYIAFSTINIVSGSSVDLNSYDGGSHPATTVTNTSGAVSISSGNGAAFGSITCNAGTSILCRADINSLVVNNVPTVNFYGASNISSLSTNQNTTLITLDANIVVGTLNITGKPTSATTVRSGTSGVTRTITATSSYSLSNISWKDITALGVIPFKGTNFVDLGNNVNIQFKTLGNGLFFGSNF